MKKKFKYSILLLIFLLSLFSSCVNNVNYNLVYHRFNIEFIDDLFSIFKQKNENEIKVIYLNKENIFFLLNCFYKAIHITILNLDNYNTTRIANAKEPFKRKILKFDKTQGIQIFEDNSCRYLYDPDHPDTIKQGDCKGYVAFPNINYNKELSNLNIYITYYKLFANILMKFNNKHILNLEIYDLILSNYSYK